MVYALISSSFGQSHGTIEHFQWHKQANISKELLDRILPAIKPGSKIILTDTDDSIPICH